MLNRYVVALLSLGITSPTLAAQLAQPQARTEVPVRSVMLFSSGVGYFEHSGTVRGEGSTELRFNAGQINDILKSLVLQDMDGGRVSTITYASQDPLSKTLRSFQVDITANPSIAALLNQLRGAKVTAQLPDERVSGTVLGVEQRIKPTGHQVAVLNVLNGATIRGVELQLVTSLSLDDPQLQDELTKALVALSQARDQDKKPVTINFIGSGERRVRIGYVVESPIWKTSYRLILDDKTTRLQGWAIVENQTESDWNGVSLSLVSGRPISFMMDLYQPLYAPRPVVAQELYVGLRPQLYGAGLDAKSVAQPMGMAGVGGGSGSGIGYGRGAASGGAGGRGGPVNSPAPFSLNEQLMVADGMFRMDSAAMRAQAIDVTSSVQSIASAAQLGALFKYEIPNVTLARQKSAMLPIITDSISVERLSIYNAAVFARNPLNGVRIKNTTGKHLLQGPVTVLDQNSYAGDARIDNLPPGQERLISYGIDLDVAVDNTKNTHTSAITAGKIEKGVLTVSRRLISTREYLANNKSNKDRQLVIEHPIREGWKLVDTPKPVESTDALHRFQGAIEANKVSTFTVKEQLVQSEYISMLPADITQLVFYARTGEISQAVRDAIMRAVRLKQDVIDTERQIADRTRQISEIAPEQARMRENMRTTGSTTQYYQRLLTKLNEQESTIERLQAERDALSRQRDTQRQALDQYLSTLTIG